MYISPFWCGVGATLTAELALLIIAVIVTEMKKKKR
jgi:hypothetical protein